MVTAGLCPAVTILPLKIKSGRFFKETTGKKTQMMKKNKKLCDNTEVLILS